MQEIIFGKYLPSFGVTGILLAIYMLLVYYIDSNICHGISLKKPSGSVGTCTCVAGIRSQQKCYALCSFLGMHDGLEHSISVDF